eukprot:8072552-Lingulodinium_polyedra.AAC.1
MPGAEAAFATSVFVPRQRRMEYVNITSRRFASRLSTATRRRLAAEVVVGQAQRPQELVPRE